MADDDDKTTNPPANQDAPASDTATHPETANPAPAASPPPVNTAAGADVVAELMTRVEALETLVGAIVSGGPDSTPTKPPWTHRKLFGR